MPTLENPRWELYAQARAKGASQVDSYVTARFEATGEAIGVNASRLESHSEVKARIRELQARLVKRTQITRLGVMDMLLEDRDMAHENKQPAAAIRAAELIGKEIGMFAERREIKVGIFDEVDFADLARLRDELIAEQARRLVTGSEIIAIATEDRELLPGNGSAQA